jgi:hypothetical protein
MRMTGKTRYLTVLYVGGEPKWFVLDAPPAGLPHHTTRMKIGSHQYFLHAEAPVVDAASGASVIFVQVVTHHTLGGHAYNPEGLVYELTKVDPGDFQSDANWREIESPFAALS